MTRMGVFLVIGIAAAILLAGCGSDEPSDDQGLLAGLAQAAQQAQAQQQAQAEAQAQAQAEAMRRQIEAEVLGQPAPQPSVGAGGAPAAPAAPGMTGVPECDEYLTKYPACLESKVPAMAKPQMMAGFEATKQAWMQMAQTPEGKASLKMTCQIALTQAKAAMQVYGCEF